MLKEFRDFIMCGNVIDLAVAVVIGAAFAAITTSLVNDIIMPIIGVLLGGIDCSALSITIGSAVIMYGSFIQAIVNFLIIALAMFLLIKAVNQATRRQPVEAPPPVPAVKEQLLTDIRDLMRVQVEQNKG